jgi:MFS family permease
MQAHHQQAVLILLCNFINGFAFTVTFTQQLFPYANSLVMSFGLVDSRNDTGYYVGLIASVTMLGRAVSAPFWGHMADVHGRKPIITLSLASTSLISVLFAFAPNYPVAVLLRLCLGLTNSIAVVGKTAASENIPKDFVPASMMLYNSGFFIGEAIGTGLGGLLYGLWLENYPSAGPNLVTACAAATVLVLILILLTETLPSNERSKEPFSCKPFYEILSSPVIKLLVLALSLSYFMSTSFQELVPLICWAEKSHGGLHMDPQKIGELLTVAMTISIVLQQCVYWSLIRRYGGPKVMLNATRFLFVMILVLPFSSLAEDLHWLFFMPGLVCVYMLLFQINVGLFVQMNEAVPVDRRGKLNGVGMLLGCAARSLAAIVSGSTFAWSLSVNSFPVDHHLIFFVLGGIAFTEIVLIRRISKFMTPDLSDQESLERLADETANSANHAVELAEVKKGSSDPL